MGLLIIKADFIGRHELVKSINDKIDSFIEQYEEDYLVKMLGKELFELFKANVNTISKQPVITKFLNIYNPIVSAGWGCDEYKSRGMKDMLLGFIYFHYVREDRFKLGMNGQVINKSETSTNEFSQNNLYIKYNESVESYTVIRQHCYDNQTDYPTIKGKNIEFASWV